jgi:DNA-binding CsgD family transcriptional regulator/tetratricopeptide (TPR) repeat protein
MSGNRPFVGRAHELETAERCLADAVAGRGGALVVSGEPGIGKTRLAEQVEEQARKLGVAVVWGRCVDEEGAPPFWPWRQVLWGCLAGANRDELLAFVGRNADDLAAIVPDLVARAAPGPAAASPPLGGEERFRLFVTVSATLRGAAATTGLVVVVDDLHWADPSSAQLLAHLGPDLSASRMLLVVTYRDEEMTDEHPASAALASLGRQRGTRRLRLDGLAAVEVAGQLEATLGRRFDDDVVERVARRSGGNPFLVAEIGQLLDHAARSGGDGGNWDRAVPEGARALITRRLDRLAPDARELLRVAAVAGGRIDPLVLADVCSAPAEQVLDHLEHAAQARLVGGGRGSLEFAHALVRDTLTAEIPASRRVGIHGRIAEHLERVHADDIERYAAAIAHHRLSALPVGDARRAVEWTERAASNALDALAYEEAARLYDRALQAMALTGFGGRDRSRVLVARAEALLKSGDVTSAIACAAEAGEEARRAGDPAAMARAAVSLDGVSEPSWARLAVHLAEDALADVSDDQLETRARLLAVVATQASLLEDAERAEAASRQALELAESAGTSAARMSALRARQMARSGADGVEDRMRVAEHMLALAAEAHDEWAALWGRLWRIDACCQLGDLDTAESDLTVLTDLAARLRQPVADWHVARTACALAMGRGRFAHAERRLRSTAAIAARRFDPRTRQMHAAAGCKLAGLTGDATFDSYTVELEGGDAPALERQVHLYLASLYASRGDLERAAHHYDRMPPWRSWRPPGFVALFAYNERARTAAWLGDVDGAAVAYELLRPWAAYFAANGSGVVALGGSVELALGCLAATLGKPDRAIRHLHTAIEANRRAGMAPFEAEARFELARVLGARSPSERSEALVLATDAERTAAELGMQPLREKAQVLAESLRVPSSDTARSGLSRREDEVAALIGRGLTNRQIADVLHLSERTVESHVQHILTKLGLQNRSQVASWVTRTRERITSGG